MYVNKKKESFITVYDWMIRDLGLSGDELIIYACIYGLNKVTGGDFFGSIRYLTKWTSSPEDAIVKALGVLVARGHIRRKPNPTPDGKIFHKYFATALEKKKEEPVYELIEDDDIDELFPS